MVLEFLALALFSVLVLVSFFFSVETGSKSKVG